MYDALGDMLLFALRVQYIWWSVRAVSRESFTAPFENGGLGLTSTKP